MTEDLASLVSQFRRAGMHPGGWHLRRQLHDNWQSVENNRHAAYVGRDGFWLGRAATGDENGVRSEERGTGVLIVHRLQLPRNASPRQAEAGARVPPRRAVLLDVPRPRVSQLTFAKHTTATCVIVHTQLASQLSFIHRI